MMASEREQAEQRAAAACAAISVGALLQDGKIGEAVSITDRVVTLDPDSAWGHAIRARLHARIGLFKDAITAFKTAFEFANREDNAEVIKRICHDVLEVLQVVIDKFAQRNASDYTDDDPPSEAAGTPQLGMGDTAENRIIARVRKMSPAKLAALEKLIDDFERTNGETTGRATDAPRLVTTEELDKVPPALRVKQHKKYDFPPQLLADPKRVKAEQSIASARKRKIRDGEELTEEEDERGRMAEAFVKQAGRRHSETSAPKAG